MSVQERENKSQFYIQVLPEHITYVNKIMEGYEYLGMVSTVDREKGLLVIRVTPDTYEDARSIISQLPINIQFFERKE